MTKQTMKKFKVAICYEEGVVVEILAKDAEEAEKQAYALAEDMGGSNYPDPYRPNIVHRDFFTQDVKEQGNDI